MDPLDLKAQFCSFMQTASWWPYWITSQSCVMHQQQILGYSCTSFYRFQSEQLKKIFDHLQASLIDECKVLHFYANCILAVIIDCIPKLVTCINNRCCFTVVEGFHWFLSKQIGETFDHIYASLIHECSVLKFYAN